MSEALRLAEDLRRQFMDDDHNFDTMIEASIELRRLAAVEQELEALKRAISEADHWKSPEETCTTDNAKGLVWLRENGAVFLGYWFSQPFREYRDSDGFYVGQQDAESYWARHEDGEPCTPDGWQELIHPLYTLKGIK